MQAVLSIAGSDSSGGAGIQADIKTIAAHKLFAETVITALTAQNTIGVRDVLNATPQFVTEQLDAVFEDIPPQAVKIGMVSQVEIIQAIAEGLRAHQAKNIVVDPVMVATSGSRLIDEGAQNALVSSLFPLADVITPNLPEAEALMGRTLATEKQMEQAARELAAQVGAAVLIKGGHLSDTADDVLGFPDGRVRWYRAPHIATENTHGTGCTLSSAIACGLAKGLPIEEAIDQAKTYVRGALSAGLNLGHGSGPLDHMWAYE